MPTNKRYPKEIVPVRTVNLNAIGDLKVLPPYPKYRVLTFTLTNASRTLAASTATCGLYTAAAQAGTAIVTAATATGLTSAAKTKDYTIASTDVQTANPLYVNVGVADGVATTGDVFIEFQQMQ